MANSSFGFAKPDDSPGFLLWQATTLWQRLIKAALEPYQVTHAQFVLLALTLWHQEHDQQPTQTTLIQYSKLDKMTVSKSLKKLVDQDYIRRVEHQQDSRAKAVYLTEVGRELTQRLVPIVEAVDQQYFSGIDKESNTVLLTLLQNLLNTIDK